MLFYHQDGLPNTDMAKCLVTFELDLPSYLNYMEQLHADKNFKDNGRILTVLDSKSMAPLPTVKVNCIYAANMFKLEFVKMRKRVKIQFCQKLLTKKHKFYLKS